MHGPPDAAGSIEDIAATCVGLVREVQPSGPYSLFGHSLGAVVVYESARQLAATGEQVDYVGMADGVHPDMLRASWARRHSVRYRLRKLVSKKGPEVVAWRVRQLLGRNPPRPVLRLPGTEAILDWGATGAVSAATTRDPLRRRWWCSQLGPTSSTRVRSTWAGRG